MAKKKRLLLIFLLICTAGLAALILTNLGEFIERSRASEIKADFSSLMTAEKAFHREWEIYSDDLEQLGFAPTGVSRFRLLVQPFCEAPVFHNYVGPTSNPSAELKAQIENTKLKIEKLNLPCKDPKTGIRLLAIEEGESKTEIWTIDETYEVQHFSVRP